jgi:hypothetical protein
LGGLLFALPFAHAERGVKDGIDECVGCEAVAGELLTCGTRAGQQDRSHAMHRYETITYQCAVLIAYEA